MRVNLQNVQRTQPNSTKRNNFIKNGQRICVGMSPKKNCKWPGGIGTVSNIASHQQCASNTRARHHLSRDRMTVTKRTRGQLFCCCGMHITHWTFFIFSNFSPNTSARSAVPLHLIVIGLHAGIHTLSLITALGLLAYMCISVYGNVHVPHMSHRDCRARRHLYFVWHSPQDSLVPVQRTDFLKFSDVHLLSQKTTQIIIGQLGSILELLKFLIYVLITLILFPLQIPNTSETTKIVLKIIGNSLVFLSVSPKLNK